jgi:hypothetical protein
MMIYVSGFKNQERNLQSEILNQYQNVFTPLLHHSITPLLRFVTRSEFENSDNINERL